MLGCLCSVTCCDECGDAVMQCVLPAGYTAGAEVIEGSFSGGFTYNVILMHYFTIFAGLTLSMLCDLL